MPTAKGYSKSVMTINLSRGSMTYSEETLAEMRELIRDDVSVQLSAPVQIRGKTYDVLSLQRKTGSTIELLVPQERGRVVNWH